MRISRHLSFVDNQLKLTQMSPEGTLLYIVSAFCTWLTNRLHEKDALKNLLLDRSPPAESLKRAEFYERNAVLTIESDAILNSLY